MLGYIGYDIKNSLQNLKYFRQLVKNYQSHYCQNNITSKIDNNTYELIKNHFVNLILTYKKK